MALLLPFLDFHMKETMNNFNIKTIIEMPMKSEYKYELNKDNKALRLDRPLQKSIPYNYGFVPGTLQKDGDPLDIFVLSNHPIHPLTEVSAKIVSVLKCYDNGVEDDKLIGILAGEEHQWDSSSLEIATRSIADYLSTYKEGFIIDRYENAGQAAQTYAMSRVWANPAD